MCQISLGLMKIFLPVMAAICVIELNMHIFVFESSGNMQLTARANGTWPSFFFLHSQTY